MEIIKGSKADKMGSKCKVNLSKFGKPISPLSKFCKEVYKKVLDSIA